MAETVPQRTPLHDRHAAAGARIVPFAGWEMPVQYAGIREEHRAVREHAGVFDVSHMGEIETAGPDAEAFLQRILSNDVRDRREARQYTVLCRRTARLDDLFTYRSGARFLTVTNAQPREDLAGSGATPRASTSVLDGSTTTRCSRCRAPRAALVPSWPRRPISRRFRTATPRRRRRAALICGYGLHGRGRASSCSVARSAPCGVGRGRRRGRLRRSASPARHAAPRGLLPPLRQRPDGERGPIEAGLGWCCKEATGFVGADAVARVRERARPRRSCPS
jgi:aminomethyltransferase